MINGQEEEKKGKSSSILLNEKEAQECLEKGEMLVRTFSKREDLDRIAENEILLAFQENR